jgi:hypothetical protein
MKYIFNNRNILRIFLVVLFSFALQQSQESLAQQDVDYSGTSAANFLKIGIGSRPMAMGDAAIATVNSPEAMFWNVAALTRIKDDFSLSVSTMDWLVETRNSYVATAYKVEGVGSFGLDLQFLDYGQIEETTVYDQDGTGRFLSANDMAIGSAMRENLLTGFHSESKLSLLIKLLLMLRQVPLRSIWARSF